MGKKECMKEIKCAIDDCLDSIQETLEYYGYSYDVDVFLATADFKSYFDFKKYYDKNQSKFLLMDIVDREAFSKKEINKFGKHLTDNKKIIEEFHKLKK